MVGFCVLCRWGIPDMSDNKKPQNCIQTFHSSHNKYNGMYTSISFLTSLVSLILHSTTVTWLLQVGSGIVKGTNRVLCTCSYCTYGSNQFSAICCILEASVPHSTLIGAPTCSHPSGTAYVLNETYIATQRNLDV